MRGTRLGIDGCRDRVGTQDAPGPGGDRQAQAAEGQGGGMVEHQLARARRQLGTEELPDTPAHPLEMGLELDRRAVDDQERLQNSNGWVGPEKIRHGPIVPFCDAAIEITARYHGL